MGPTKKLLTIPNPEDNIGVPVTGPKIVVESIVIFDKSQFNNYLPEKLNPDKFSYDKS